MKKEDTGAKIGDGGYKGDRTANIAPADVILPKGTESDGEKKRTVEEDP